MFGGFGDDKGRFNDVKRFDPDTRIWLNMPKGNAPKPMYLHTSVVYGDQMLVFGGSIGKDTNDLYSFNLRQRVWDKIETENAPRPRYGHGALMHEKKMYIVGGCRHTSEYFRDAFEFDMVTCTWKELGSVPMDMAYHTVFTHGNKIYVFGGFNGSAFNEHLYVLERGRWKVQPCTGTIPSPRCGCATGVYGRYLYVYGGYRQLGHINDLHRLDLVTFTWEEIHTDEQPVSRAYLHAAIVEDKMYIFGGYNGTNCISDFRYLQLPPKEDTVNIPRVLQESSVDIAVDYALRHFGSAEMTMALGLADSINDDMLPGVLDRAGLTRLLRNMVINALPSNLAPSVSVVASPAASPAAAELPASQKHELQAKLELMMVENDELKKCRICYDSDIDTVLRNCNHLAVCEACSEGLSACPVCRKPVSAKLKVFWS